jgi:hypothetical protein
MPIELFTPEGICVNYHTVAERLPKFLEAYPPKEGYRVEIEATDTLAIKPGLMRLYEAALGSGKNPKDLGLPEIPGNILVFKAKLLDPAGNVIQTASSLRPVAKLKDYETGETAARQRLMAACGFGGEDFNNDELLDIQDQGLSLTKDASQTGAPEVKSKTAPTAPEAKTTVSVADQQQQGTAEETIPPAIIRQIQHHAKMKGVEPPPVRSLKEAHVALRDLMAA